MSASFLGIPGELRNRIYELVLINGAPVEVEKNSERGGRKTTVPGSGLLRVNRIIHHEASSFFYSENQFDFATLLDDTNSFLQDIGTRNAKSIRHVLVEFPSIYCYQGKVTVEPYHLEMLSTIRKTCTSLRTLTLPAASTEWQLIGYGGDSFTTFLESLDAVETHFSLPDPPQEIIVEMYDGDYHVELEKEILKRPWTVKWVKTLPKTDGVPMWEIRPTRSLDYSYFWDGAAVL